MDYNDMTKVYRCFKCGDVIHASASLDQCSICKTEKSYREVDPIDQITVIEENNK